MIVYKTDSDNVFYKNFAGRLALLIGIGAALWHIKENPVVIAIAVLILTFAFLASGNENIVVYQDRFVYNYGSFIKKIFPKKVFYYKDIQKVSHEGAFTYGLDKLTDSLSMPDPDNFIDILFKNDKTERISIKLYKKDVEKAIDIINYELQKFLRKSGIQ